MNARSKTVAVGCSLVIAAALQTGCAATPKTLNSAPTAPTAPTAPKAPKAPTAPAAQQPRPKELTGKVVETMDSGGYTYINIEKDGKTTWVAMPPSKVQAGQQIRVWSGMEMGSFTSRTLNRTFDEIVFSPGIVTDDVAPKAANTGNKGANPAMPKGHPTLDQQAPLPQGHPAQDRAPGATISGKVVETMESGGYTYVNLEKDGKKTWVALPVTKVSVGQELKLVSGAEMKNFSSKSLNRTFDSIIFSVGLAGDK